MAVFRIEKSRDYTVMSKHHLRDTGLSLKSKGLLSMMLSLLNDWNYTTRGLAKVCKEGTDSIGSALDLEALVEQLRQSPEFANTLAALLAAAPGGRLPAPPSVLIFTGSGTLFDHLVNKLLIDIW